MNKTKFTDTQIEDIEEALWIEGLRNLPHKKLTALLMIGRGLTQADTAKVVEVEERTVRSYCREFRQYGIASILEDRQYRPSSCLEPFYEMIKESFSNQPPSTSMEAATRISVIASRNISPSHARTVMSRLGFKCLKPGSAPGKANVAEQLDFFEESLRPRLEEAKAGKHKVFFVDVTHFVRGPYLRRVWSLGRLWIRTASGKGRLNVIGALDACADTIELLLLPAYSPNLNLIERVWKWIKGQCLYNKYYPTIKQFKDAILQCIIQIEQSMPQSLKSMLTLKFHFPQHTGNL